jgi:hypothetical protein
MNAGIRTSAFSAYANPAALLSIHATSATVTLAREGVRKMICGFDTRRFPLLPASNAAL